jgi:hypothetical protein
VSLCFCHNNQLITIAYALHLILIGSIKVYPSFFIIPCQPGFIFLSGSIDNNDELTLLLYYIPLVNIRSS